MRVLERDYVFAAIRDAICKISFESDPALVERLVAARAIEQEEIVQDVLDAIIENNAISRLDGIPLCQDTGSTIVFAELGNELVLDGFTLQEVADAAAAAAKETCYLRASMVCDPLFSRQNTTDNQPTLLYIKQVPGSRLKLKIAQKGGGAENMSFLMMLSPTVPVAEIREMIVCRIVETGSRACPPLVIGIGIGGNFERSAILAKEALFEDFGRAHPDANYAALERDILSELNRRGVGAQGVGGGQTAVAVHILHEPCHIASLPIAVNLQCHAHRHIEIDL